MFFQKIILFCCSIVAAAALFADVSSAALSLADEAQAKADKISAVESELKQLSSEASLSGDSKLKVCIENYLGTVKGLAASANGMTSQIVLLVTTDKTMEARNQISALNALAESATQALAKAKSCEKSDMDPKHLNKNDYQKNPAGSVSDAMKLNAGNDLPTEIDRSAVEGSDPADAAGVETSDIQRSSNETSDIFSFSGEDPQDVEKYAEEEEGTEVQSPTE